jgi:flagellin
LGGLWGIQLSSFFPCRPKQNIRPTKQQNQVNTEPIDTDRQGLAGQGNVKENTAMSSMGINTNVTSLIAQRKLSINQDALQKSMERLASGYRINHASDDAAGLTISQNLVSQVRRLQQADRNTQDGISVLQTTEGSLEVIVNNLQRVRELTVQAGNDTNNVTMRSSISNEIKSLLSDVDRISISANINGVNLLDGSATNALLQVGPNSNAVSNTVDISQVLTDASSAGLKLVGATGQTFASVAAIDLTSNTQVNAFLTDIDTALRTANTQRSNIGSFQNKLESVDNNLNDGIINFSASNSRIRDVDIAAESANLTQSQILTQASTLILSQTNDLPKMILSLLQK